MPLLSGTLTMLAKGALTAVIAPFVEEARDVALNAAQDAIRNTVTGKMSVNEWAGIVIEGVDKVKERVVAEDNLRFIGGKMRFTISEINLDMVTVSFQLYFLDELEQWQKAEASCNIPVSAFTTEALDELKLKHEIIFEVE